MAVVPHGKRSVEDAPPLVGELLRHGPPPGGWLSPGFEPGLVSVIITTYNIGDLLGETLASILAQTYDQVEVIVTDDGSTDNTQEVLAGWRERFRAERGWELKALRQANRGPNVARNLALREARGEYIHSFDSDDLMAADRLAAQVGMIRSEPADLVVAPYVLFYPARKGFLLGRRYTLDCPNEELLSAWLDGSWGLIHWSCLMTRRFVDRLGPWNEHMTGGQTDVEHYVRMLLLRPKTLCCPDGPVFYRQHRRSLSYRASLRNYAYPAYALSYLEERLTRDGTLARYRKQLARKFRVHSINAYRDGAIDIGNYCADRAGRLDPDLAPSGRFIRRLAFKLGGLRLMLRVKGLKERRDLWRERLTMAVGLVPKKWRATWVEELPLRGGSGQMPSSSSGGQVAPDPQ